MTALLTDLEVSAIIGKYNGQRTRPHCCWECQTPFIVRSQSGAVMCVACAKKQATFLKATNYAHSA